MTFIKHHNHTTSHFHDGGEGKKSWIGTLQSKISREKEKFLLVEDHTEDEWQRRYEDADDIWCPFCFQNPERDTKRTPSTGCHVRLKDKNGFFPGIIIGCTSCNQSTQEEHLQRLYRDRWALRLSWKVDVEPVPDTSEEDDATPEPTDATPEATSTGAVDVADPAEDDPADGDSSSTETEPSTALKFTGKLFTDGKKTGRYFTEVTKVEPDNDQSSTVCIHGTRKLNRAEWNEQLTWKNPSGFIDDLLPGVSDENPAQRVTDLSMIPLVRVKASETCEHDKENGKCESVGCPYNEKDNADTPANQQAARVQLQGAARELHKLVEKFKDLQTSVNDLAERLGGIQVNPVP